MDFNDARLLDQLAYDAKLADFPRGINRARINDIANGVPPYTEEQERENNVVVNVNFLEMTVKAHDARAQFYQGFLKPGKYFRASTDYGAAHQRQERSTIVTNEVSKIMKRSIRYYEAMRAKFAQIVLHGIAPAVWENKDTWCNRPIGIEDALVPSGTLVGFENLPYIILYRSFTGMELQKLVKGPVVDPGWNMPLVNRLLKWVDEQGTQLMRSNWPEVWAPEKQAERMKESGFYASDQLPTIDTFDFYFYVDDGKKSGWIRRIILDAWGEPQSSGAGYSMTRKDKFGDFSKIQSTDFLYNSKKRTVYDHLSNFTSFQFGDLSAVAPFRYHSVRSLGFLLYATAHLQNRMRCKFSEAVFEALMMYFRVGSMDDAQRALKLDMVNKGFIDETIKPVPANERFQVNAQLVELGLQENARILEGHSGSYTPKSDFGRDRTEKTRFQVMAELNISTSLVSAALQQAYSYQTFEYREIFRRFCQKNSTDSDVREFQANCIRRGIPPKMLLAELWEIEPERIVGAGNKTMEMAIAEQMMQWRQMYDPSSQRVILRDATMALTDDPSKADQLVPEQPEISNSVHDAQMAAGTLMQGLPLEPVKGINHQEYAAALIRSMSVIVQRIQQTDNMGTPEEISGLNNMAQHISQSLQIVAQDKEAKMIVKMLGGQLSKLMNMVKGFQQRLQQAMVKRNGAGGQPQMDPKDAAKIVATQTVAQQKAANLRQSHALKTAQRQVQFDMEQRREDQRTAAEIERENLRTGQELAHNRLRSLNESGEE